jgi:hypothetical protein
MDPSIQPFVIISVCYLLFTVTDGAIRMIVLFHAYNRGFSAIEVAVMFSLYELAGVVTNLLAGVAGARWGIRSTLITGLGLQVFSYGLLFAWSDGWSKAGAIAYVTVASMFGGIAKDLTKLGGKTVTKLVTKDGQDTRLFKMVSLLTGMKNSLKGVGYFAGAALLDVNYYLALSAMLGLVVLAIPFAVLGLSDGLGTAKKSNATLRQALSLSNPNLNWLSLARLFLFASRDFWFEVPLPFYLRSPSCASLGPAFPCAADPDCAGGAFCGASGSCENLNVGGGCGGPGLSRLLVGTFLALYIIVYGQVQSWTPQLVTSPLGQTPPNKRTEIMWGLVNCAPTLVLAVALSKAPAFLDEDQVRASEASARARRGGSSGERGGGWGRGAGGVGARARASEREERAAVFPLVVSARPATLVPR